jgi:hypothetical protein
MKGLNNLKKIGKAAVVFAIGIAGTLITDKASDKLVSGIKNYKKDDEDNGAIDVNEFVEDDSEESEEEAEETED